MDLRTTITKVLLGEQIVTEEKTTVVGKMKVLHPNKAGKGNAAAAVVSAVTEHEHEGKKYTVRTDVDNDGDYYHDVHDHSTGQTHHNLIHGRHSMGDTKASPVHKQLIKDHLKVTKKKLIDLGGKSDEDYKYGH